MSKYHQKDLIRLHSTNNALTLSEAEIQVKSVLATLKEITAPADTTLTLRGFGRFARTERKAYTGRNPQTGGSIEVPAKQILRFKE